MASGVATTPVALTDSSVTLSTFNSTQVGAQTIDVNYEGFTEQFGVIVEDNIQTIRIKQTPTKVIYQYGEALDVTGGVIEVIRSSGSSTDISITPSMVTGFNPNQLEEQTLIVTYEGKTTTYDITVEDYVTDINIKKPTKLVYKLGDTMDLTGGEIELTMASGLAKTPVAMTSADVTIQGFDTSSEGIKTIKVTYKGFTKEFAITVVDSLNGVVLKTLPNKTDYLYGESLDLTGATLEVTKESGATEIVQITKDMVTGYNSKKLGNQPLTVTYEGFTEQFVVNVEDYVSKLKVEKPEKVEYEYGESLDLTGGKVAIIMASGAVKETVEMTASMVTGFNSKQEGTQTINIVYKGLQGNFQVKVEDKVKGISMNSEPDKTTYKYGEELDLTGATITVVKSSGITTIPVTKDMVSDYDTNTPGTQVITVTYKGFTTKFIVVIEQPEEEEAEKTEKPIITPINKSETPITETIDVEEPVEELVPEIVPETNKNNQEKPTITLGIKDEKQDKEEPKDDMDKKIAAGTGMLALLILLILIISRKNAKVYVQEDGEFVLGGKDKISKKNPKLNIDQYLDGETYQNKVKIVLKDSISEKLDGKEIEIKHRGNMIKHKVNYKDEPYEIILE